MSACDGPLDLLVVGSGVAGLSAVVRASTERGLRVGLLTKGALSASATQWAQGGVAAVLDGGRPGDKGDSPLLHLQDTLRAGAGLCDPAAVEVLVNEGPTRVRELAALGARFDTDHHGRLELSREGGHSRARVVHAGGAATGAEVERTLVEAATASAARIWEGWFALDLLVEEGRCAGVEAVGPAGSRAVIKALNVLLATGGAGQLYSVTTNPPQACGDGLAMAIRAGAVVADLEFFQFHPTALYGAVDGPRPLLSEALRGEGALLRNLSGERFVDELEPRDVVAAAVLAEMQAAGAEHVWLDLGPVADLEGRFPSLCKTLKKAGYDPGGWVPVAPAAHYHCGGVLTDLDGATTLPGLWAAGEVACSGVHGANRLASNSLLEGMVFGPRVVEALRRGKSGPDPTGAMAGLLEPGRHRESLPVRRLEPARLVQAVATTEPTSELSDPVKAKETLQAAMSAGAGVLRSEEGLLETAKTLEELAASGLPRGETANLVTVAIPLVGAALARRESRGGHRRSDHPATSAAFKCRLAT